MKRLVVVLVAILLVAHQDYWAWDRIEPLAFGFMPIGLTWHVGISIAAAIVWALAVHYCWPADVDIAEQPVSAARSEHASGERPQL